MLIVILSTGYLQYLEEGNKGILISNLVKNPAAETAERTLFECLFFGVIPASEARRESFRKDSGPAYRTGRQAGMTEIWNCGRDHRV